MRYGTYPRKKTKLLIVIAGPTAIGKSALAIDIAKAIRTEILCADSRQFYREMEIGTSRLTEVEQEGIPHHFAGHLSIHEPYSAGQFETDAIKLLEKKFEQHSALIICGGSGLYIDAVCRGFDSGIQGSPEVKSQIIESYKIKGLVWLQNEVKKNDLHFYQKCDQMNPARLIRALEVFQTTGKPFSEFRKGLPEERSFRVLPLFLNEDRTELYKRINSRVDKMMEMGFEEEAQRLIPYRNLPALQAIGYQSLFDSLEGKMKREEAVEKIKQQTRNYAKRQITWFNKDSKYHTFGPSEKQKILNHIVEVL